MIYIASYWHEMNRARPESIQLGNKEVIIATVVATVVLLSLWVRKNLMVA